MASLWVTSSLAVLLTVRSYNAVSTSDVTSRRWERNTHFDDALPRSVSREMAFPVKSRRGCAVQCLRQTKSCASFFFNFGSGECFLERTLHEAQTTILVEAAGFRYYAFESATTTFPTTSTTTTTATTTTTPTTTTTSGLGDCALDKGYIIDWSSSACFRIVVDEPKTWTQARDSCLLGNETLAVLEPVQKAGFIQDVLLANPVAYPSKDKHYFIGASRPAGEWGVQMASADMTFVWENGQTLDMALTRPYWRGKDPDGRGRQNVVAIMASPARVWIDSWEDEEQFYICEKPLFP